MLAQVLVLGLVAIGATAAPTASNATVKCPVVFDGRVQAALKPTDFDTSGKGSPFGADYVKGQSLKWSDILQFPSVPASRFDNTTHKPFEVTISDKSIFQTQKGFRRAGLQFNGDSNTGSPGWGSGIKTLHFSVKQDAARPLNLSHEYLVRVWSLKPRRGLGFSRRLIMDRDRTCGTRPATTRPIRSCSRPAP